MRSVKYLLAAGAASLLSSAALAADLPPPPAYAPPPMEEFGGWYLRGDIGFSNQRVKNIAMADGRNAALLSLQETTAFDTAGIFGIGIGYQFNNWLRGDITGQYRGNSNFKGTDLLTYPESYVQTPDRHPMERLVDILEGRGLARGSIGVEMDNYYYSAKADAVLRAGLGNASFVDATGLVNWLRAVKSPQELDYMRIAGRIVSAAHRRAFEIVEPGIPKNRVVAELFHVLTTGVDGYSGDHSAFMPIVPSGADASAPHLTWDERPMKSGEGTYFEIGGCYKRYHCPQCRTIYLGKPTQAFLDAEKATLEGMEAGLSAARPGKTCGDIADAYFAILKKHGISKTSRAGYGTGLSYPPDWGERTLSIRPGDRTELKSGMTIHFMTGLWLADMGFELTETIAITDTGYELLANTPQRLMVKE